VFDLSQDGTRQLSDPDGRLWTVRRFRLDPRTVRSMLKRPALQILVDTGDPSRFRWLPHQERASFAEMVKHCYGLPLNASNCAIQYVGHEMTTHDDERMLYIETWC
jgi:hypothetical protein